MGLPFRGPEWFHCQSLMPIQKYRHILGYINKAGSVIILSQLDQLVKLCLCGDGVYIFSMLLCFLVGNK